MGGEMRLMVITEEELRMTDWKIVRSRESKVIPFCRDDYRESRARIQAEIWKAEDHITQVYDPAALDILQKRIDLLKNIVKDLTTALNI